MNLPHKYPIKLIDTYSIHGDMIIAEYTVPHDHPVLEGHFPHFKVWPGVYLIESMNQAAGQHALYTSSIQSESNNIVTFVTTVDNVKFKQPVFPGNKLIIQAKLKRKKQNHVFYDCNISTDNKVISVAYVGLTAKKL